jgi:hypothetical protein
LGLKGVEWLARWKTILRKRFKNACLKGGVKIEEMHREACLFKKEYNINEKI